MSGTSLLDAIERNAEQINRCHGLDVRHHLLIQMVRELVTSNRKLRRVLEPFAIPVSEEKLNEVHQVSCGGWHLRAVEEALSCL